MTSLWEIQEDEAARLMQDDRQQEVVAIPPADWERHHTAVAALMDPQRSRQYSDPETKEQVQ